MNFFKKNERNLVIIAAIVAIALAIGLPFLSKPTQDLLPKFALSQLAFTAVAFFIILLALYFTIVQLRKSMAKPELKVVFSESNKLEASIDIPQDRQVTHELKLSVINTGNAVTKLFQIDFEIPAIFHPRFDAVSAISLGIPFVPPKPIPNRGDSYRIISFCSYEKVYCFIGNPAPIHSLILETCPEEYNDYPNELIIPYRVFGDWAEKQEGELKVICSKKIATADHKSKEELNA